MTKDEMLKERDRLGRAYQDAEGLRAPSRLVINAEFDYRAGFNAALKLVERERVKPLMDLIEQALDNKTRLVVPGDSWVDRARRTLTQVEEWE